MIIPLSLFFEVFKLDTIMVYSANHKTVLVVDHGPKFLQSSNEPFVFDNIASKSKASNAIPLNPLFKTHWTCSIEAVIEYCRIVYDIYAKKKLISFITSDTESKVLTKWGPSDQDIERILYQFGTLGLPRKSRSEETSITPGLTAAVDRMVFPTNQQTEARLVLQENADRLENNGRVIVITQAKGDAQVTEYIRHFHSTLVYRNKEALQSDDFLPIKKCELVIVIIHALGKSCTVTPRDRYEVSPNLNVTVVVNESGKQLAHKMVSLAVEFYDLCITSVTGIPMKEEQNANSSASYDVELLHAREAHGDILTELAEGSLAPSKEISGVDSVTLKWCTPKSQGNGDMQLSCGAFAISPVDVNSRPSLCLTNFLLAGRSVMLEQPRKSGAKILSHMLCSHGGQIYIHQLITGRSILDDPPSISEGVGGRITDYRIPDFQENVVKESMLYPSVAPMDGATGNKQAMNDLDRRTRVYPLTMSDTILFTLTSHIDPLPSLIVKRTLTEEDVHECRKAMFNLIGFEERHILNSYATTAKAKGLKKEEQSRIMWSELEELLQAHASTSDQHMEVYNMFLNCRPSVSEDKSKRAKSDKTDVDNLTHGPETKVKTNAVTDAPLPKKPKMGAPLIFKPGQSLLTIWTERVNAVTNSRHMEFSGRQAGSGPQAQLYKKIAEGITEVQDETTPGVKDCPDH